MKNFFISIFLIAAILPLMAENTVIIDKPSYTLYVINGMDTIFRAPVCLGKNLGQKKRKGDHKTPEGEFKIKSIENSSKWDHDFHDGQGKIKGAYGPWFFRLNTPQSPHIGIHGTCFPKSMNKRESDGCIRMRNEDLIEFKPLVKKGTKVIIRPDKTK